MPSLIKRCKAQTAFLLVLFAGRLMAKDADYSDLLMTIHNPADGSSGLSLPVYPSIDIAAAGSGPIVDRLRAAPDEWSVCTSLDSLPPQCMGINVNGGSIPAIQGLNQRHYHTFSAWFATTDDSGAKVVVGKVTSTFSVAAAAPLPRCDYRRGYSRSDESIALDTASGSVSLFEESFSVQGREDKPLPCGVATLAPLPRLAECLVLTTTGAKVGGGGHHDSSLRLPLGVWDVGGRLSVASHQALLAQIVRLAWTKSHQQIQDSPSSSLTVLEFGARAHSTPLLRSILTALQQLSKKSMHEPRAARASQTDEHATEDRGNRDMASFLLTVDDDLAALEAVTSHFPGNERHAYVFVPPRSRRDGQEGCRNGSGCQSTEIDHWVQFFAGFDDDDDDTSFHDGEINRQQETAKSTMSEAGTVSTANEIIVASSWRDLRTRVPQSVLSSVGVVLAQQRSQAAREWTLTKFAHAADFIMLPDVVTPAPTSSPSFWDLILHVGAYESTRCEGGPTTIVVTNRNECGLPETGEVNDEVIQPEFHIADRDQCEARSVA